MKIFHEKMFTLVSLNIIKDSLDVIKSRNEKAENSFYTEKRKNLEFLWHCLLHLL